jgi:hypothetical protein
MNKKYINYYNRIADEIERQLADLVTPALTFYYRELQTLHGVHGYFRHL